MTTAIGTIRPPKITPRMKAMKITEKHPTHRKAD